MELLKSLGIDDDTYVIFTSDNGPHEEGGADPEFFDSNGPLRGIKRDLYEGGIRVPFIAWGGEIKRGGINNDILANWDFFPTVQEITNGRKIEGMEGISFSNVLKNKPIKLKHDFLYWEFYERGFSQAIRMGDWKAVKIKAKGNKTELYNLKTDIGERNDIADQHPEIVQKAEKIIQENRVDSDLWKLKK